MTVEAGDREAPGIVDLGPLGLDNGADLLLGHTLRANPPDQPLTVTGSHPALAIHLPAWARANGCGVARLDHDTDGGAPAPRSLVAVLVPGPTVDGALVDAQRAGATGPDGVVDRAPARWGLAARGALVEAGGPPADFDLDQRDEVWTRAAPRLYAQAVAAQWDPNTAVDWDAPIDVPTEVEDAVVQVMTYLVENEQAALVIPARFASRVHPHFREVAQLLAVQAADEARHVEVFSRRAALTGRPLGVSSAGGRASLQTLLAEPDFTMAHFLLSVLGEGTFLHLLGFIQHVAPDPVTRRVVELALADERRHVAFGMAHVRHRIELEPELRTRLAGTVRRRHDVLMDTAGLSRQVHDALVLLAAGQWSAEAIVAGKQAVRRLQQDMHDGRERRLRALGFDDEEAAELAALHTRNFM